MVYIHVKRRWTRGPYIAKWLDEHAGQVTGELGVSLWWCTNTWKLRWITSDLVQPAEHGHWQVEIADKELAVIFKLTWC